MESRFFEFNLKDKNKIMKFNNAVEALNSLVRYYQELEKSNPNQDRFKIKLESPWQLAHLWGSEAKGIEATLFLETQSSLRYTEHPLIQALYSMGFQLGSFHAVRNEFSGGFSVYDERYIEQIPERCQAIINPNTNELRL